MTAAMIGIYPASTQIGGYARRRAKTEVALRDGFLPASVLG